LIDVAVMIEARVRALQRDPATEQPIIFVSDPIPRFGNEDKPVAEKEKSTTGSLLLLPPSLH